MQPSRGLSKTFAERNEIGRTFRFSKGDLSATPLETAARVFVGFLKDHTLP
jgi:hypothetical protein